MADNIELLFFDTFSHESSEELNLDLVQFPKPVFVSEVRIIPLGARVQADFPGGVRLGATNPSQFEIEFFVNDLSKPGASTFESLGELEYKQNGNIHLACERRVSTIPTDGLVLRGWYTTITLAVYGALSKGVSETVPTSQTPAPSVVPPVSVNEGGSPGRTEWGTSEVPPDYVADPQEHYPGSYPPEPQYQPQEYPPSYPDQWNSSQPTGLLPPPENYETNNKDGSWDTGGGGGDKILQWERTKDHSVHNNTAPPPTQPSWDWEQRQDPSYRERGEWTSSRGGWGGRISSRGRSRGSSWDSEEGGPRKRPHTPPLDDNVAGPSTNKWTKTSPHFNDTDKDQVAAFDSLSPGDVESISSEGDIPEPIASDEQPIDPSSPQRGDAEPPTIPSPPPTPEDPEQFEPILSDEDNMEDLDAQFQDADFEDTEEPDRVFDPFQELKSLEFLASPDLSEGEVLEWRLHRSDATPSSETCDKLEELIGQWNKEPGQYEAWVELAEQAACIVVTALPHKPELTTSLIRWVEHGLNIEEAKAQPQPGYKVRHIKAGLRLALALCSCTSAMLGSLLEAGLHNMLFALIKGENMALSLRLLALRTLDASLRTQDSVQRFCNIISNFNENGYQLLLTLLQEAKQARLQFAISTILRKIHLYEILEHIKDLTIKTTKDLPNDAEDKLSAALEEILNTFKDATFKVGQFRRFLPVKSQFELPTNVHDPYVAIYSYIKSSKLLETILYILTNPNMSDSLITPSIDLLNELLNTDQGIRFLASNTVTTLAIIRALLSGDIQETPGARLGMKLAYSMRVISALDTLASLKSDDLLNSETTALESLRSMYCFGESLLGRLCTAHVVSKGDHIVPIMNAITSNKGALPGRSYAMDLLINSVILVDNATYLSKHGEDIKALIALEPRVTNLNLWLKNTNNTNVASLCEICKNLEEKAGNLPSELISALRALKYIALGTLDLECVEFEELNQRHALLELFSLDGASTLANILNKVGDAFEQPALHTAAMLGPRGTRLVNLMLPALSLLRAMLSVVSHTQGANFRNLTSVPALLTSYTLLHAFPHSSPLLPSALQARSETVHALLAYTQPCSEEALPRSLWTQMIAEVLKHATSAPNTFLPGLELLSELLPLPLPIASNVSLSEEDTARVTSLHRLWGAHLHPLASAVHEMISLLGAASSPPLISLLRRVCVQLADLESSSALMVGRALLEPTVASIKADHLQGRCSTLTMRRLTLLASICDYAAPKAAILHLLRTGKIDDESPLASLCWALSKGEPSGKAQCSVAKLFSTLCDPTVATLITVPSTLPSRELLVGVVTALLQFVIEGSKYGPKTIVAALQALNVIASTENGIFHIKTTLESKEQPLLSVLTSGSAVGPDGNNVLGCCLELLRICSEGEVVRQSYIAKLIGWPAPEDVTHPFTTISNTGTCVHQAEVQGLIKSMEDIPATEIWQPRELTEPTPISSEVLASQFSLRVVTSPLGEDWSEPPGSDGAQIGALERLDLAELSAAALPDLNLSQELSRLSHMHRGEEQVRVAKAEAAALQNRDRGVRRPYMTPMRSRIVFGRAMAIPRGDTFRSRPPNTSRPPSLHVDDFLALESAGQQPTGPTGYNKQTMRAKEMLVTRPRIRSRGVVSDRGGRFSTGMRLYRGDPSRGLSRGLPPNLGRGMGEGGAPSWPGEQRIRPSIPGDKMMVWGERGGPRRDVPRHPRTFSR